MNNKSERESNIELLRILSMLGVIILHYNNRGFGGGLAYAEGSINYYLLLILESFAICAVDLFLMISGFFLCTKKDRGFSKPIELIMQVVIFNCGLFLMKLALGTETLTVSRLLEYIIPANYFVVLYIAVYLISPYLNILIENLETKQLRLFVITYALVFSVYPTLVDMFGVITGKAWWGLSTIGLSGSEDGYTVVNFMLMYIIGAYLRNDIAAFSKVQTRTIVILLLGCASILTIWALINEKTAWAYCNPVVILLSALILLLFLRLQIGVNRIINKLAEGAFSVFLLHGVFLPYIGIPYFAPGNPVVLLVHIALSTIIIFGSCYIIHIVYSFVMQSVFKKLKRGRFRYAVADRKNC